jgi:hypothetical protein
MPNPTQILEGVWSLFEPRIKELIETALTAERKKYSRADEAAPDDAGDGWQDEPATEPAEETPPADDDPWGAPEPKRQPARRSNARGSGSKRQASSRPTNRGGAARGGSSRSSGGGGASVPTEGEFEDSKGKTWTFGLADAPECEHGEPAAEVIGVGSNNREYTAWACPHGFKDWRNKCDLFDFQ